MRPQLTMALIAMSLAALTDTETAHMTPEQKKAREERIRLAEAQEAQRRAARTMDYQAEQDAIAAPYREARRQRNLKKLAQQAQRKP